jgi:glycosyltransferase involved in cell wall biosynthesis
MRKVLIIQGEMKQYRVPFFRKLSEALRQDGICLKVGYSDPKNVDGRNDNCDLPGGLGVKVGGRWLFGGRLLWQPLLREIVAADLVITEEANRYVLTHVLTILSFVGLRRVAFWGLGENKSIDRSEFSEWLRRRIVKRVSWWFAYTRATTEYLVSNGMRPDRITVVHNAVDTRAFAELLDSVTASEVSDAKRRFGIEANNRVGLFCGLLSADKGIDFLLDSAEMIRARLPDFHLFVLGGGPEREKLEAATRASSWIHYVGPKFGKEKATFFKMANVFLLPGRVGLAILDAFAAGLPLLTTDISYHGPEIEYLENWRNGLMTEFDPKVYAEGVVNICSNPRLLQSVRKYALQSSTQNSVEFMINNFRSGVLQCLSLA